ncbi:MAG: CbtA family protein [Rhodobacteraceae bacterium]|nr:CbtA family protein [Paracoccaceae bacterium]
MIRNMLASAVFAGVAAGLLAAVLHFAFVQPYILLGEEYESGAAVHFAGVAGGAAGDAHDPSQAHGDGHAHEHAAGEGADAPADAHDHAGHDHGAGGDPITRNALTVLFAGLVYLAYALILVAGFGLARVFGHVIGLREGVLWGIAGFAAFQLAPAMGLTPALPGTMAADLADRQVWWWATVAATAGGLGLIAYGRGLGAAALGVVMLALPHVIGAPLPEGYAGVAPPEVAAAFSARVLGVALVVWAVLGGIAGYVWARETAGRA